jgi:hypothetical protein
MELTSTPRLSPYDGARATHRKKYGSKEQEPNDFASFMKYLLIFLTVAATTLYADTYEGKNGKVAHNARGTAVQTSNGTAAHARGSSTVRSTNGAYHATSGTTAVRRTTSTTAVHTNANWNSAYWHSNKYGYWNGQRGYWHVVGGKHVFVVVN